VVKSGTSGLLLTRVARSKETPTRFREEHKDVVNLSPTVPISQRTGYRNTTGEFPTLGSAATKRWHPLGLPPFFQPSRLQRWHDAAITQ
jgi:hypothetical protein